MINEIPSAAHHLIASLIPTIYQMILKISRMEVRTASLLCCLSLVRRGNLWRRNSGSCRAEVFTNCSCSCPPHENVLQFGGQTRQGIVEAADLRLCAGKIGEPKIQGGIPLHKKYMLDTQEKTDPRNTNRFPLSHGKLRGFRLNGREWTFSNRVYDYPPWDASEDLVEIERGKFMEAKGDSEELS